MKKVFIKTYGCQMNERDSEAVAALLVARGYELSGSERDADVILLNTCSVRDLAEQKALNKMAAMAHLRRRKTGLVFGFLGCMAQSRGAALVELQPHVDLVVGTQKFHHLPEYLDQLLMDGKTLTPSLSRPTGEGARRAGEGRRKPIVDVGEEAGSESAVKDHMLGANGDRAVTAFVSIMQGCDMECSFCIVPQTRGTERSRSIPEIVEEVRRLADGGVKEVTLLGQIVTSYGRGVMHKKDGRSPFVQLLGAVHEVPGIERIRFTAPHPKGFGDDLVAAYRELPRLCSHAHLPVQSGSDRVLQLMKRGYNREWFLRIVEKLRAARPGIGITTDIIVGFPGETEEDCEATASLMRAADFEQGYIFKYSPRRDTPAAEMGAPVSEAEKKRRNQMLLEVLNELTLRKNRALVGSVVEILVEGRSEKAGRRMCGRTGANAIVVFDGSERHKGQVLKVRIERATTTTLYATPIIHL
jgi:tRNA-2-methylthio-N6-dimethylallyladenosine synthase